ncbi:metallophosphoesterase family protein [Streptomyces buecherae]|uniref:metallophosphoesterase family protein n=1 Tax=Streptomyces buecherae TaxID=2763006 RepID=UPI00367DCD58
MTGGAHRGDLLAISDLHVSYEDNRAISEKLRPGSDGDWLIVAGDVGEVFGDIERTLRQLSERFAKVIWVPGNHELWTHPKDPVELRGVARYDALVEMCRSLGVATPEDPYLVWEGAAGPLTIAPVFTLYDYTFRANPRHTQEEALAAAYESGVVCTDEHFLHPDPYPTKEDWSRARVAETERRLAEIDPAAPPVLINHWPLTRLPTEVLYYPDFALWCGTQLTADWHRRFNAAAVIYGHLHIPRVTTEDGVRFEEVSLGYPREWRRRGLPDNLLRPVLPRVAH